MSDAAPVSRWPRWNVRVAGGFGAVLIFTGVSGLVEGDSSGLISQAVPYDLFHIAFGALGLTLGLRRAPVAAARFNLGFGLIDLYQVVAGLSGAFPAELFALRAGDHVVHLVLGVLLVACGAAGLRRLDPSTAAWRDERTSRTIRIMGRREGTFGAFLVGSLAVCALSVARPAWAEKVAFEAATGAQGGNNSSFVFLHTVGTGTNRFLVLAVAVEPASASVSSATFAGKALTRIGARSAGICRTELWGLTAPASGAQSVLLNLGGSPTVVVAGASSYTGVDPRTPTGPFASHSGSGGGPQDLSVSVAIDAGDFTVDVLCGASNGGAPTPKTGALQTQRWRRSAGTLTGVGSTQPNITSDGRATMSWTLDGSGTIDWSISTVPLNPGPTPPPPDAGPDLAPDVAPDLAPDLAADRSEPDLAPDLSAPEDLAADAEPDVGAPDAAADLAAADLAADVAEPSEDAPEGPQMVDVSFRVGCACRASGRASGGALPLVVLGAVLFLRRRRR